MPAKIFVTIIKAKSVDATSDLNKMVVHLEQILAEKEEVDVKQRQSVTDASIKNADFIVFAGWDTMALSNFFLTLSAFEKQEIQNDRKIFLFDEPGSN
jgi:dihydrodipicolinate synthase/N-acetylneuraminate lyase